MSLQTIKQMLDSLTWLDIFTIFLSAYIIFESLAAICSMPGGYKLFCHKAKYVLAFGSALAFLYYAIKPLNEDMQWLLFGASGTLSSFVWPRMVWRLNTVFDELFFERH